MGGIYSGVGVTDNGNGRTFDFDPVVAGLGTTLITYTLDTLSLSDTIEVFPLPEVSLNSPDTIWLVPALLPYGLPGEGQPSGGVYASESGLFVDDGDGIKDVVNGN